MEWGWELRGNGSGIRYSSHVHSRLNCVKPFMEPEMGTGIDSEMVFYLLVKMGWNLGFEAILSYSGKWEVD